MDVRLTIAGVICLLMAAGHTTIGVVWVLPKLTERDVPRTPFGPPSMTVSMIRVTWFVVTIFCLGVGTLLLLVAADPGGTRELLLRTLAATWATATVMGLSVAAPRLRSLRGFLRLPVPVLWVVVAVLCWQAA